MGFSACSSKKLKCKKTACEGGFFAWADHGRKGNPAELREFLPEEKGRAESWFSDRESCFSDELLYLGKNQV